MDVSGVVYSPGTDGPNQGGSGVVSYSRVGPETTSVQGQRHRAYRQGNWPGDGT